MAYTINGVDISQYGIIPGRTDNSNIALSGWLDLPGRMGEICHEWAEEDGAEPYVLADEIDLAGIDIAFDGLIKGTKDLCLTKIESLLDDISSATDTIILGTPYGNFNVYLKSLTTKQDQIISEVNMIFRQPVVNIQPILLPAIATEKNTFSGIPFSSFGLHLKSLPDYIVGELRAHDLTTYNAERYKKTKRGTRKVTLDCWLVAFSMSDFIEKCNQLRIYFSESGLKEIRLYDKLLLSAYAADGFSISEINTSGNKVIAGFKIQLIVNSESII